MIFLTDILVTIPEKVVGQPTKGMPEGKRVNKDGKEEEIVHIGKKVSKMLVQKSFGDE